MRHRVLRRINLNTGCAYYVVQVRGWFWWKYITNAFGSPVRCAEEQDATALVNELKLNEKVVWEDKK